MKIRAVARPYIREVAVTFKDRADELPALPPEFIKK
jgi:hypothetical protein